jgi:phage shock protein C
MKHLYKNNEDYWFGGVCGGMAEYFEVDSSWVRLIFMVSFFIPSIPIILVYLICWLIMKEKNI